MEGMDSNSISTAPEKSQDESNGKHVSGENGTTIITSSFESLTMRTVDLTNGLEDKPSDHNVSGDSYPYQGQGETNDDDDDDDFGDFEESSSHNNNTNNTTAPTSQQAIHVDDGDDVQSDDPFVQKFARVSRQIFARFLPSNMETHKQVDESLYEIPRSTIDEYLVRLQDSIPTYTPEEDTLRIQQLKSLIVKVEGTTSLLDSSTPSIVLEKDEPDLYAHFIKPWGDILSQEQQQMKRNKDPGVDVGTDSKPLS